MNKKPFYFLTYEGKTHIFPGYGIPLVEGENPTSSGCSW
jgi:hypothetical protein